MTVSEVKRWEPRDTIVGFDMQPLKDGSFVLSCDYAAAQSELAALREDFTRQLQDLKRERQKAWDARDAAEQRNAELITLLRRVHRSSALTKAGDLWQRIDAALNPTESGAGE